MFALFVRILAFISALIAGFATYSGVLLLKKDDAVSLYFGTATFTALNVIILCSAARAND